MLPKLLIIIASILFSSAVWAGMPVEATMKCPVGGEEFTITKTPSCTTMGRTMSFRPRTTCDFITRLPVCPSNGLPVYQEFSEEQVIDLTRFMESEAYASLKQLPPWYRAYRIAEHLGETKTRATFGLLLEAFWYQPEEFLDSETAMDHLLAEAGFELERLQEPSRPFLHAFLGYAMASAERFAESSDHLAQAKATPGIPEELRAYIARVESCHEDMSAPECQPSAPFKR